LAPVGFRTMPPVMARRPFTVIARRPSADVAICSHGHEIASGCALAMTGERLLGLEMIRRRCG